MVLSPRIIWNNLGVASRASRHAACDAHENYAMRSYGLRTSKDELRD